MSKAVIIFSGFNPRAVIAFLRTLESRDVEYGIIAKSKEDEIFLTRYSKKVLAVRSVQQLDINDLSSSINKLQERLVADRYIITPSTEALNRFLLDNREHFNDLNCILPLVNNGLYKEISDKQAFGELCKTNGILTPAEHKSINNIEPPFVAKPKTYFSNDGQVYSPVLVFDQKDKLKFMSDYKKENFYFQEYIEGSSYYLLYYFYENGDVDKFSQINYIQQPQGKSIIGAESSDFHLSQQSKQYEELFKSVSFRGLVMVEVKQRNDKFYMIEANPRFWGPSQLFVDAGANLFDSFLADYGVLNHRPKITKLNKTKYFWEGGIEYTANGQQITFHGYSKANFDIDIADWQLSDIYNREDTRDLYTTEIRRNT